MLTIGLLWSSILTAIACTVYGLCFAASMLAAGFSTVLACLNIGIIWIVLGILDKDSG